MSKEKKKLDFNHKESSRVCSSAAEYLTFVAAGGGSEAAVIKQYLITAADGKNYKTKHYSLQGIIAVGFKIENERAVQFCKWANHPFPAFISL